MGSVVSSATVGKTSVAPVVVAGGWVTAATVVVTGTGLVEVVTTVVVAGRGGRVGGELATVSPAPRDTNADPTITANAVVTIAAAIHGPRVRRGGLGGGMAAGAGHNGASPRAGGGANGIPIGGEVTPPQPPHRASVATMILPHHTQLAGIAIAAECTEAVRDGCLG